MNSRPVEVIAAPPRFGDPVGAIDLDPSASLKSPSVVRQAMAPVSAWTATSSPQGGATQGMPEGESRNCRDIENGAPSCSVISTPGFAFLARS